MTSVPNTTEEIVVDLDPEIKGKIYVGLYFELDVISQADADHLYGEIFNTINQTVPFVVRSGMEMVTEEDPVATEYDDKLDQCLAMADELSFGVVLSELLDDYDTRSH